LIQSKLLQEKTYLENLKTTTENSIISYNNSLTQLGNNYNILPQTLNETNWNFRERSLGLCDNNYSYCYLNLSNLIKKDTDTLEINNFDFNLPLDSIINGISVDVKKHAQIKSTLITAISDNEIKIKKPDGTLSNNKAIPSINDNIVDPLNIGAYWSTTTSSVIYGSDIDNWGLTLTPQEINNNNFSILIKATGYKNRTTKTVVNTAFIDCVCITVYYTINNISTGNTYISNIERNTIFDTDTNKFGEISELIYSKVNENENPLKLKMTEEDKSIYPMCDEFGYSWNSRFIFKSSWDNDYYIRTKNEIQE
jgi:hypothetical protein